ncbi:MAG: hypothetical protein IJP48_10820 [Synergistaceae bacterium]|nr:hypothetical protein [Synergistaceae bacterium]
MAVITTQQRVSCTVKLNNGTTETGQIKTINQSLGSLKVDAFDAQKALNIVNLLRPVLELPVYKVQNSVTNDLEAGE